MSSHLAPLIPALWLGFGLAIGTIEYPGLALGAAFIVLVLLGERWLPDSLWRTLVLLASIALAAHLVPGFTASELWPPRTISQDAPPYALRLSWDKALVGMALLAWWLGRPSPAHGDWRRALPFSLTTLLLTPPTAWLIGVVAWQPKWPDGLLLWLAVNLGVAVLAEELLFRGLLQPALITRLGTWPGLLLTAALFGAAHLPFSPTFALVATLAGLGYGLVFQRSGQLRWAIALHVGVNLLHFLLLSYPLRLA
ncbi:CPBP family intramembrane glutamic endopeptidase [Pseudomonas sp. 8Z]|uniref:CPBP family intramembrane glutamic endopeptidase n=1 Tax=Pseudomonas sp. 8Z TaxID=2653166 RepID=UPI00135B02AC|nr:CPBP family intramembrane glutamic endopeptidase [Pseudomonas sp. 8Z]